MNGDEFEVFEAELQRLKPARPPAELVERLAVAPEKKNNRERQAAIVTQIFNLLYRRFSTCWSKGGSTGRPADYKSAIQQIKNLRYLGMLRWLAPGAVVVALALGLWLKQPARSSKLTVLLPAAQTKPGPKPDNLEIDRQLLTSFDAVAPLPSGEPVRFRCREWMDQVVVRDPSRGVVIEQRKPHLEIVPVSFETY